MNPAGVGKATDADRASGPMAWLPVSIRGRVFVLLATATVILLGVQVLLDRALAPYGIVGLELAGSPERAGIVLVGWGDRSMVAAAFGLGLDYLFAIAYALTLAMACEALAGGAVRGFWRRLGIRLAWGSLAAGGFDLVENTAIAVMLLTGRLAPWAVLATLCAVVKLSLVGLALLYVVAGLLAAAAGRARA